ncbi:KH domain-containing, RNA-binding, signal transduction-associated protein 2-like isoform X1 [Cydia splendana]|uniref:KH domain-containing, RNA-binding, signal transduction-associated protein 2-like isoform X1 n=2 Tax=Cydia splendana TaxID=1100963 RepID=UPI00300C9A97
MMNDKNGYNNSDFKRNSNQDMQADADHHDQDGDEGAKINDKAGEYMRELLSEKIKLNTAKFPYATKLIDQEVTKVQASGRLPPRDFKYVDVYHEKPVKVTVKVLVPLKEHPKFNFVGKLLGPKGNTMKQLQEETMCKMAVLGRGSMRDRQKEEELRNSLDPKYAHLTDELHVEISALAPPAEAHARIAYALAEVKKYLLPDVTDMMGGPPMRDMGQRDGGQRPLLAGPGRGSGRPEVQYRAFTATKRSLSYQGPVVSEGPPPRPGPGGRAPRMPAHHAHAHAHAPPMGPPRMAAKTKVISILDRARSAMESSYGYDDPYAAPEPPVRGPPRAPPADDFYYGGGGGGGGPERYYEEEGYGYKEERDFKSSRDVGTRRPQHRAYQQQRPQPYQRPPKPAPKKRSL